MLFFSGFGYVEYRNDKTVQSAITGMEGFKLGGQTLQVGPCVTPPDALNYVIPASTASILPVTTSGKMIL